MAMRLDWSIVALASSLLFALEFSSRSTAYHQLRSVERRFDNVIVSVMCVHHAGF